MGKAKLIAVSIVLAASASEAAAQQPQLDLRYSWMLPKTVIDATITYTFDSCEDRPQGAHEKVKIAATLVPRAVPDMFLGRRGLDPAKLVNLVQDRNVTVKTFPGTHILNSIGSTPASQIGPIATNVLAGVGRLVAVGLGVPAVPFVAVLGPAPGTPPPPPAPPVSHCGAAQDLVASIKQHEADILGLQDALKGGVDEAAQKKIKAQIQAHQDLISGLKDELSKSTITIKRTINPGFTAADITGTSEPDLYARSSSFQHGQEPHPVAKSGLVARFSIPDKQLQDAKWYKELGAVTAQERSQFTVNVYMLFEDSVPSVDEDSGVYRQTPVPTGHSFRDVAYMPVVAWRGDKSNSNQSPLGPEYDPVQLGPAQLIAFGQYGRAQAVPFEAAAFQALDWSITFLENGETADAKFVSKATGLVASGVFNAAASAANSIATEQRNAASASGQATALQGQADLIYQTQRLEACQANPSTCPRN